MVHHHFVLSLYSIESQFSTCWFLFLNLVNILSLSSVLKMHFLKVKVTFVIPIIESFVQNLHGSLEYYFSLEIFIAKLVEIDDTVLTIPLNWFKLDLPRRPNNLSYICVWNSLPPSCPGVPPKYLSPFPIQVNVDIKT